MNNTLKAAVITVLAATIYFPTGAQTVLNFTRADRDPVSVSMAGTGLASGVNTAWASFKNPSKLPLVEGNGEAGASFLWSGTGVPGFAAGGSYVMDRFAITAGAAFDAGPRLDILDSEGTRTGDYLHNDFTLALGAGYAFTERFSVGAAVKFARELLTPEVSISGVSADLMATFRASEVLTLAGGLTGIGTTVTDSNGNIYPQPAAAVAGASAVFPIGGDVAARADMDFGYFLSGGISAAVGGEMGYEDRIFVRAGYRYCSAEALPSLAGGGIGYKAGKVRFDAAAGWTGKGNGITATAAVAISL